MLPNVVGHSMSVLRSNRPIGEYLLRVRWRRVCWLQVFDTSRNDQVIWSVIGVYERCQWMLKSLCSVTKRGYTYTWLVSLLVVSAVAFFCCGQRRWVLSRVVQNMKPSMSANQWWNKMPGFALPHDIAILYIHIVTAAAEAITLRGYRECD